ncbi:MAG: AraC family transcriptional regulator, partial [Gammaproteobacteria bacterium]
MAAKERAPRRVALVVFPGVEALDVAGPSAVFAGANRMLAARDPAAPPRYEIVLLATSVAPLRTSDGLSLVPDLPLAAQRAPLDTLLVAGGPDIETVLDERLLVRGLARLARRARRVGSVCTGSFLLAAAGLLDGRRATTHWAYASRFAARFPGVHVDADAIYIRDGEVYTSAGVSAGMDLSMALV